MVDKNVLQEASVGMMEGSEILDPRHNKEHTSLNNDVDRIIYGVKTLVLNLRPMMKRSSNLSAYRIVHHKDCHSWE